MNNARVLGLKDKRDILHTKKEDVDNIMETNLYELSTAITSLQGDVVPRTRKPLSNNAAAV